MIFTTCILRAPNSINRFNAKITSQKRFQICNHACQHLHKICTPNVVVVVVFEFGVAFFRTNTFPSGSIQLVLRLRLDPVKPANLNCTPEIAPEIKKYVKNTAPNRLRTTVFGEDLIETELC